MTYCSDCPPEGYPTDETRCNDCPRRVPKRYPPISELAREFAFRGQFVEGEERGKWTDLRL